MERFENSLLLTSLMHQQQLVTKPTTEKNVCQPKLIAWLSLGKKYLGFHISYCINVGRTTLFLTLIHDNETKHKVSDYYGGPEVQHILPHNTTRITYKY